MAALFIDQTLRKNNKVNNGYSNKSNNNNNKANNNKNSCMNTL